MHSKYFERNRLEIVFIGIKEPVYQFSECLIHGDIKSSEKLFGDRL